MRNLIRKTGLLIALQALALHPLALAKGPTDMDKFKKPTPEEIKKKLTPEQFEVTQKEGTEPPFHNEYWNNHKDGIYVDVVTGEPLFSSLDKFDSGTGWPSFTRPITKEAVNTHEDHKLFMARTEVRSKRGDSHLGHLFDDGPAPTGMRYCINSASLRFVPVEKLKEEGYEEFLPLFQKKSGAKSAPGEAVLNQEERKPNGKQTQAEHREIATLAGGCFWGVQELIRKLPGVIETTVGYTGGLTDHPTYSDVKTGSTGHAESIEIVFDPSKISYEEILTYYFRLHDPTTKNRQGNDVGSQYRSSIFYHSEEQKKTAERVKERVDHSGKWKKPVVTEIVPAGKFFKAEDYHQDYLQKHPDGYTCHFLRD